MLNLILILTTLVNQPATAFGQVRPVPVIETRCGALRVPRRWSYCVTTTVGSTNRDVVYFLHGGGQGHKAWTRHGGWQFVRRRWADNGVDAPTVVSISFGPYWLLAERNAAPASGLLEVFANDILPHVEREFLGSNVGARRLLGFSMGGFNAGLLAMKRPGLFNAAALISPSIVPTDTAALERSDPLAYFEWMLSFHAMTSEYYPSDIELRADALANQCQHLLIPNAPRILVSTGRRDALFYDGAAELVRRAEALNIPLVWEPHAGTHQEMLVDTIADFLVE